MQKVWLFIILAAASFAVAAEQQDQRSSGTEQQQTRSGQATQGSDSKVDQPLTERARADGAAGGTASVPEERRKAVGAGAGPHLHDNRLGRSQDVGRDQAIQPPK